MKFNLTFYWACVYLSMLGFKLIRVSEMVPCDCFPRAAFWCFIITLSRLVRSNLFEALHMKYSVFILRHFYMCTCEMCISYQILLQHKLK